MTACKATRDYLRAKAEFEKAAAGLQATRATLNAELVRRRRNGERAIDIAAELGLSAAFVNRSIVMTVGRVRRRYAPAPGFGPTVSDG